VDGPLVLTLTLDVTDAEEVLRDRGTERSDLAVLNVEFSVVVVAFETGLETLEAGRDKDAPEGAGTRRKVDACERTDMKDEAEDFGLSAMDDVVLVEITLRRGVMVVVGALGTFGLVKVTLVLGGGSIEEAASGSVVSSSVMHEYVGEVTPEGRLGVSLESGRGPTGG
jgi:hypothetical protein